MRNTHLGSCIRYSENDEIDLSSQLNDSFYQASVESLPESILFHESLFLWLKAYLALTGENLEEAESKLFEGKSLLGQFGTVSELQRNLAVYLYNALHEDIFLAEQQTEKAIALVEDEQPVFLRLSQPYYMVPYNFPFQRDILARAYLQEENLNGAITEYKRLTSRDPKSKYRRLIHPLYYYRLALLFEKKGDTAKAIENYEKFLDLWKDADPGISEVEDARKWLGELNR